MSGLKVIPKNGRTVDEDTVIASIYNADKDLTRVFVYKEDGTQIYSSTTGDKQEFIKNNLNAGIQYTEKVVEVTTGGKYITGDDGTQIQVEKGSSAVYLYYTATTN